MSSVDATRKGYIALHVSLPSPAVGLGAGSQFTAALSSRSEDHSPNAHVDPRTLHRTVRKDSGFSFATVQFTSPIVIAEEDEEEVTIGIMRLGSLRQRISVCYNTEDGSAWAGERYVAVQGIVELDEGENYKEFRVGIVQSRRWAPTLEFKVHLSSPEQCVLGEHLRTCRVKIMDNDAFPTDRYRAPLQEKGLEGLDDVSPSALFWEYFKLTLWGKGVFWRTIVTLLFDQFHNAYFLFTICINIYLVDDLFNIDESVDHLLIAGSRERTAMAVGSFYIGPLCLLHLWDYCKTHMDLPGICRVSLQQNLMRKYMNYSEESRAQVRSSILIMAITEDAEEVADGFIAVLDVVRTFVKLVILAIFIVSKDPFCLRYIVLLPSLMIVFGVVRHGKLAIIAEIAEQKLLSIIGLTEEICLKYSLIAEYWQRARMNEVFGEKAEDLRRANIREKNETQSNEYFPLWLGSVCAGVYIIVYCHAVLRGDMSLGRFLATIQVFQTISTDFSQLYMEFQKFARTIEPLKGLTFFFNLSTDLALWKAVQARRSDLTCRSLSYMATWSAHDVDNQRSVDIALEGVTFDYAKLTRGCSDLDRERIRSNPILSDSSIVVRQGVLVAVTGPPDCGKATLMKIIGHVAFPVSGAVHLPTFLRVQHVSQEPVLLRGSPWRNLTFGVHYPSEVSRSRVKAILHKMHMKKTLAFIEDRQYTASSPLRRFTCSTSMRSRWSTGDDVEFESMKPTDDGRKSVKFADMTPEQRLTTEIYLSELTEEPSVALQSPEAGGANDVEDEDEELNSGEEWLDMLTYAEKVKVNIARALVMNPDVLVLQRPLQAGDVAELLLKIFREFVDERGICMLRGSKHNRQPRTCFFTPETIEQAKPADVIWCIDPETKGVSEATIEELQQASELTPATTPATSPASMAAARPAPFSLHSAAPRPTIR